MRLLTILASFAASAVAGMAVVVLFGWIDSASLSFDRIGYVAPLFAGGAISGAAMSLPIAVPTICVTELIRRGPFWVFFIAGLATAFLMIGLITSYTLAEMLSFPPYFVHDLIVITLVSVSASCSYWLFAWKLFPPKPREASDKILPG